MVCSACLTDEALVELIEHRLPQDVVSEIHRHAAGCPPCERLLIVVALGGPIQGKMDASPLPQAEHLPSPASPPWPPIDTWSPPESFNGFRLEGMLGRGGMGVVYLARDLSLNRQVAIKFIAAGHPSETVRTCFMNEARAIARLKHPNVVTVHSVGEVDGHPYLVSEYVSGQRLAELARPLPWWRVLRIGCGLGRGLRAAHRQGVLHRDITPRNIILASDGEVKLLDFGLAELIDDSAGTPSTRRVTAGTPYYMAPEVLKGARSTPQSDIYALGLVLYELCTGKFPPSWDTAAGQATKRLLKQGGAATGAVGPGQTNGTGNGKRSRHGIAGSLCEVVPGVDPDLAMLIDRCLRPDPSDRFVSMDALQEELERLQGATVQPIPAGNPYRGLQPFEAEHRALFFGRDGDIEKVLERLRSEPLVLIAGDSGVGKSSLCRAGILPRVAEGMLDERRPFTLVSLWPGRHPVEALAAQLAPVLDQKEAELRAALAASPDAAWLGQELRERGRGMRGVFLFVDQLEELFTLGDPTEAACFAKILAALALPAPGVRVLLAVRGDFLTRLAALPGLGEEIVRALYLLLPLSPEGTREAIVGPARSRAVAFESETLIAELTAAGQQDAGSLPLLQFALAELWERRDKVTGRITRAAFAAMGGVSGALSRHADLVLARLDPAALQAARRVLLRLVAGEGTRVARGESELGVDDAATRTAVRALAEGRLLHATPSSGEPTYQIAHEALIASWRTLRRWLDEDIGHRALRLRVEAASAEWERLCRLSKALWRGRQLDEVLALDPAALGPRERAFLDASRRHAARRRRYLWWLAVLTALLVGIGLWEGVRLEAQRRNRRLIAAAVSEAGSAWTEGRTHDARARGRREQALALFDGRAHPAAAAGAIGSSEGGWNEAERVWGEALAEGQRAEAAYARADQALATALLRDSSRSDVREQQAALTYDRILLAEGFHQSERRGELLRQLERLDDEQRRWAGRLTAAAELRVETWPPATRVTLMRYVDEGGVRRLEQAPRLGGAGGAAVRLPPGSYRLEFTREGWTPVHLPILLERGEEQSLRIELPLLVPVGYVYIPPGCFLFGGGDSEPVRKFMHASPLHRVCQDQGYLIGRTEVTVGDWLDYLSELPRDAPERRLFAAPHFIGGGMLLLRPEGSGWRYSFSISQDRKDWPPPLREGALFAYVGRAERALQDWRRFPMSGVSVREIQGYLAWLDRSGRLPGARLCREDEWERAARGADDRRYPHGDRLLAEEANVDETYGRRVKGFGPDAVGSYPASVSPFGLMDMSGNALEWTTSMPSEPGSYIIRGGAWYYDAGLAALAFNRTPTEPDARDVRIGLRVCAPSR